MKRSFFILLLFLASAFVLGACSSNTAGCKFDVDCPGSLSCVDGVCVHPDDPCFGISCDPGLVCQGGLCVDPDNNPCLGVDCPAGQECVEGICREIDPCLGVSCDPGEVCSEGLCVNSDVDQDQDGFPASQDCDDTDPAINPDAPEVCNEKDDDCDSETDEHLYCGGDCAAVDVPPAVTPPATCDVNTPCGECYLYQATSYYCRALGLESYRWLAVPQATQCTTSLNCATMVCQGTQVFHCDARVGAYVEGGIPTTEAEQCNLLDDNCDGATDEGAAADSCTPRENGRAVCTAGECMYICDPGFHPCGELCADDNSPETCGSQCSPCQAPDNALPACVGGLCDFVCNLGFMKQGAVCLPCDTDQACGPQCSPCSTGTTCCGDACYNLLTDPNHCGDCLGACPSAGYTCCLGEGCCAPAYPQCCGQTCCESTEQCCPGDFCCETGGSCCSTHCCAAAHPNCCGAGCCDNASTCCNETACCNSEYPTCCPDGCCPVGYGICCGDGCCPDNTYCCGTSTCCQPTSTCCTDGCCPSSSPVCCGDGCCPAGTTCCENETACCSKDGTPIPIGAHEKSATKAVLGP